MSSFSSVVQKSGKKIAPKAVPRRNVPRRPISTAVGTQSSSTPQESISDQDQSAFVESALLNSTHPQNLQSAHSSAAPPRTPPPDEVRITESIVAPSTPIVLPSNETLATASSPNGAYTALEQQPVADGLLGANEQTATAIATSPVNIESAIVQRDNITLNSSQDESSATLGGIDVLQYEQQPSVTSPSVSRSTRRKKAPGQGDIPASPRKRRKITQSAATGLVLSLPTPDTNPTESAALAHSPNLRRNSHSQPTDELLQSATQRAASVSELASDIESQTRSLRPQSEQLVADRNETEPSNKRQKKPSTPSTKPKRITRKKTGQEQAIEVVANVLGRNSVSTRQRADTPENAESYEIEPAKVTMGELCEDSKLGKKSTLEAEMQENWAEILQRRKEDRERALLNAEKHRRKGVGQRSRILDNTQEPAVVLAPAMTVVNGVIVVDQASREIDRGAQLQQAAAQDIDNVREDRDYYKYVNQGTVGVKPGRGQHSKWDEESNERFFRGLRMFGTDFLMIANMFPGLSRKQIKMKFIREENADKARVLDCLRNREPVQLEEYANMANKEAEEYHTLDSLQKELDEQEKRLREEDVQRRKKEGFIPTEPAEANGDQTEPADTEGDAERQTASVEPGRFDSMAREIVGAAIAPKKRSRKTNAMTGKRGPKGGRRPDGGVEEVLGSIHDVAV